LTQGGIEQKTQLLVSEGRNPPLIAIKKLKTSSLTVTAGIPLFSLTSHLALSYVSYLKAYPTYTSSINTRIHLRLCFPLGFLVPRHIIFIFVNLPVTKERQMSLKINNKNNCAVKISVR